MMMMSLYHVIMKTVGMALLAMSSVGAAVGQEVKITTEEDFSGMLSGEATAWHFEVASDEPVRGRAEWTLEVMRRVVARGEMAIEVEGDDAADVTIPLEVDRLKDGVVVPAELRLAVYSDDGDELALHEKPLWIFSPQPFVEQDQWLTGLDVSLFDPEGDTADALDGLDIPYRFLRTSEAVAKVDAGLVIIGEGVSLADHRGLAEKIVKLAAAGRNVLVLASADGAFPLPGAEEQRQAGSLPHVDSIEYRRAAVIKKLDKRLDSRAWPPDNRIPSRGLALQSAEGRLIARVTSGDRAWPWIDQRFEGGGRLVYCGFAIVERWNDGPAPRYLFARALHLFDDASPTSRSLQNSQEP